MFTKGLILMLLGSSLVVAASSADPGLGDTNRDCYNKAITAAQVLYDSAVITVNEYYEKAKANAAYAAELTNNGLAYLREQGNALKDVTIAQIKAANDAAKAQIKQFNESVDKTTKVIAYESEKILSGAQKTITQIKDVAVKTWCNEVKKAQEYHGKKGEDTKAASF